MTIFIGAETAKLAGLQIDQLNKLRNRQMTLSQLERFNNLSLEDREARFGDWKKPEPSVPTEPAIKFAELVDLGLITVPPDYDHASRLTTFSKQNCEQFSYYHDAITDVNFSNPTRILKPGDKLWVRVFKQIVVGTTTSEERMAFLATQKAIHTGAQGVSLVFDQKRDQLPKGLWYSSFDEKDRLWRDAGGNHRVPDLDAGSDGDFTLYLGHFEDVWRDNFAFLCFGDV